MAYYRLYFLDSYDHVQAYESFEAEAEGAALERAALRETNLRKELWCERRRVWRAHSLNHLGALARPGELHAKRQTSGLLKTEARERRAA